LFKLIAPKKLRPQIILNSLPIVFFFASLCAEKAPEAFGFDVKLRQGTTAKAHLM
jgi:hypothetical protein